MEAKSSIVKLFVGLGLLLWGVMGAGNAYSAPKAFDYQGLTIGMKKDAVEAIRSVGKCEADDVLPSLERCSLATEGDEGLLQATFEDGLLIQLEVIYQRGMVRKHSLVANQLRKKFKVKPRRRKIKDQYDASLRYNQSTFRRGRYTATLRSSDSSAVGAAYGIKMDEDNNFVLTIQDKTAMTRLEKKRSRSVKQAKEKKKKQAAEGMKF